MVEVVPTSNSLRDRKSFTSIGTYKKLQQLLKKKKPKRVQKRKVTSKKSEICQLKCHSPLPDWIVDVDGLGSDEDTAVQRNFRKGILATDLNFHTNVRINCD